MPPCSPVPHRRSASTREERLTMRGGDPRHDLEVIPKFRDPRFERIVLVALAVVVGGLPGPDVLMGGLHEVLVGLVALGRDALDPLTGAGDAIEDLGIAEGIGKRRVRPQVMQSRDGVRIQVQPELLALEYHRLLIQERIDDAERLLGRARIVSKWNRVALGIEPDSLAGT